jgi:hypothetical protein
MGGEVASLCPDWPNVRCASCATVYEYSAFAGGGLATTCPKCGHGSFNTSMSVPAGFSVIQAEITPTAKEAQNVVKSHPGPENPPNPPNDLPVA